MTDLEKAKLDELMADESIGQIIKSFAQSYADKRVTEAVLTTKSKLIAYPDALERLKKIEKAASAKIASLELEKKVLLSCFDRNIPFSTITDLGLSFADEKDVETKLDTLAVAMKASKTEELNRTMASGYRPGSEGRSKESKGDPLYAGLSVPEKIAYAFTKHLNKE